MRFRQPSHLFLQAGLFSAVCSAFVIEIYQKLQLDPNDQSAALLRAILLTLNNSAIPGESPTVPPIQQVPPSEIVTVTGLLYASLLMSLLAAFVAMLGKQWLVRYRRHAGGSMIERCGDRQRKYDGLQKWPFRFFIDSLPVMLQVSLLLLACALCRYMASINTPIAYLLIALTSLGLLFYIGIVVAGASSYECPFQMPGSALLRNSWTKVGPHLFSIVLPIISAVESAILSYAAAIRLPLANAHRRLRSLLERVQLGILHIALFLPPMGLSIRRPSRNLPLPMTLEVLHPHNPQETVPWFTKNELAVVQGRNTYDVWCVAWILGNITDPEALDAAIRLAGTIRWFEDGIDVRPLYDLIVVTFRTCFGSNKELYPGLRNRAYYSGRAILWIHVLAMCKSETFPLPTVQYTAPGSDHDFTHILYIFAETDTYYRIQTLLGADKVHTAEHSQWVSSVLLHLSWAISGSDDFNFAAVEMYVQEADPSIPLDAIFNRLLMCCNLLGSPVGMDALKIQDKSYGTSHSVLQIAHPMVY